jgi:hypothetical protein
MIMSLPRESQGKQEFRCVGGQHPRVHAAGSLGIVATLSDDWQHGLIARQGDEEDGVVATTEARSS